MPSLGATLQFLALGLGPVARSSWLLSILVTAAVLLSGISVAALAVVRHKGPERHRALGLLVFLGNIVLFALAIGWGRAEAISIFGGWPLRYVLLAVPALYASFFAWELYGPPKFRTAAQLTLFLIICFLTPFNTVQGLAYGKWYRKGMDRVSQDLAAGVPRSVLAERHNEFLLHSVSPDQLASLMSMLHHKKIGPFAQMKEDVTTPSQSVTGDVATQTQSAAGPTSLVTSEIRHSSPEAAEIFLVWGINGWNQIPKELYPPGTEIKKNVMHTPMLRQGDAFVARVQTPPGVTIDYGFLITKKQDGTAVHIWEANGEQDYHRVTTANNTLGDKEANTAALSLVSQEFRYHMPEAGEVFLVWGINGWKPLPEALRPAATEIKNNTMRTPMLPEKGAFVARVRAPQGATIEYGFLITDKSGIFDLDRPVWDSPEEAQIIALEDGLVEIKSERRLDKDLVKSLNLTHWLAGGALLLGLWLLIYYLLGQIDK
jgi:hypothetical protein